MEKDNSISQASDLVLQVNRLNQIMENTAENILNNEQLNKDFEKTIRSYQQYKDIKCIAKTFANSFIEVKQNNITTEKLIAFEIADYFDVSKNSPFVQELNAAKQSSPEDFENAKKSIAQRIYLDMEKYVKELLEKLNQYSPLKFYLKPYQSKFSCHGINLYNRGLNTDIQISFLIDII